MNILKTIEALSARLEKGKEIVAKGDIWPISEPGNEDGGGAGQRFACRSQSNPEIVYLVDEESCSCPDFQRQNLHLGWCKHRLAAEILKESKLKGKEGEK